MSFDKLHLHHPAAWALGETQSLSIFNDLQQANVFDDNQSVRRTAADSIARWRSHIAGAAGVNELELSAFAATAKCHKPLAWR